MPDYFLPSTDGIFRSLAREKGRAVCFFYPYTGQPGVPDPVGWDEIPGAHGSTPQALAFSKSYGSFLNLNVKVFGVSLQEGEWQREFVTRTGLAFPLLSDHHGAVSTALQLPRFQAAAQSFLTRVTLIVNDGEITHVKFPIASPAEDAAQCFELLRS